MLKVEKEWKSAQKVERVCWKLGKQGKVEKVESKSRKYKKVCLKIKKQQKAQWKLRKFNKSLESMRNYEKVGLR